MTSISRKELYHLVWWAPLEQVAEKLGITIYTLTKTCKDLDVPRPGFGYWQHVKQGHLVTPTPLPDPEREECRVFWHADEHGTDPRLQKLPSKIHEEIRRGRPAFRNQSNSQIDAVRKGSEVGARRKRLMSLIFHACERLGGSVTGTEDAADITFDYQTVSCRIREKLKQVRLPPSKWDTRFQTDVAKRGYGVGLEVTGELIVELGSHHWMGPGGWTDKRDCPLEDQIPAIAQTLQKEAAELQRRADERYENERLAEERRKIAQLKREEAERQQARVELLLSFAANRRRAEDLRQFLTSLRERGLTDAAAAYGGRSAKEWLSWAEEVAETLDPLRHGDEAIWQALASAQP